MDIIIHEMTIDEFAEYDHEGIGYLIGTGRVDVMDEQPTVDAVEVVRCKDCIHCSKEDCWTENGVVTLNSCWNHLGMFRYVLDNDYCSRGYRRDNNG